MINVRLITIYCLACNIINNSMYLLFLITIMVFNLYYIGSLEHSLFLCLPSIYLSITITKNQNLWSCDIRNADRAVRVLRCIPCCAVLWTMRSYIDCFPYQNPIYSMSYMTITKKKYTLNVKSLVVVLALPLV